MENNLINAASNALELINIFQTSIEVEVTDEYAFSSLAGIDNELLFKYVPVRAYANEYGDAKRLTVILSCEAIVVVARDEQSENTETEKDPEILLSYSAKYAAEYHVIDEKLPAKKALDHFCFYNTPFHVWPFWREDLSSSIRKAGLCSLLLPMYNISQIAGSPETEEATKLHEGKSKTDAD